MNIMAKQYEPLVHDPLEQARQLLDSGEPSLSELAAHTGLSASHLQRRFSARYGISPAEYLAQKKLTALKSALRAGSDVTAALYDAGYGSPSRVYEQSSAKLGMTPATYRAGGLGVEIRWSMVDTALGKALVAATERGICAVELGDDAERLGDLLGGRAADAVDVGERDFDALVGGDVDPRNTSHSLPFFSSTGRNAPSLR